ncbi:sigma-70 family RNA polymerase sigma factor [bacterium]|nr:sigma-70 family RNA polymerase sigma factor [bacterium]
MKTDLEKLEELVLSYRNEKDLKKKHVLYLNLVENALKLVKKIVSGIYPLPKTVSRDDLIQVGAVGMLKAIDTYVITERGSFKTYASKYIKGKILHYLRDKANIVKPPRETSANIAKVKEASDILSNNGTHNPSVEEISSYVGLAQAKVQEIIDAEALKNIVSLDQNVFATDGFETLIDRIKTDDENSYEKTYENKKVIEFALNKLEENEKKVIFKYYIEGLTKKDIAKDINVSAMQVTRIIKRALNKMYTIIENDLNTLEGK